MAHFYGTLDGQRGRVSRLGSKSSGLTVAGYSWSGGVVVDIRHNAATGQDIVDVALVPHFSTGKGIKRLLYSGPVDGAPVKES